MRLGRIVGPSTSRRSALVQPGHVWPQPLRTHTAARSRIVMAAVDSHTLGGLATSSSSSSSSSTAAASPVPPWRARRGGQQQQQLGRGRGRWRPAGAANSNTVPYTVSEELVATFAAAGVLLYTSSPDSSSGIQVLLMRQVDKHGSAWSILGGKVDDKDHPRTPQVTAAREVQEESHGLVEAASILPLLGGAPQAYYASGRYICYLVRLQEAQQLPAYYKRRVQEGRTDPAAAKCVEAAWFDLDYVVQSAAGQYHKSSASKGDRVQLRRVAVDLGWRMVAGWLRQLVAGKAPEQVLQWAPPPGEPEPLEKVQIRRSPSEVAAAAAPRSPLAVLPTKPKGVPQAETTSSSSSQGLTYKEVAATVEAAAEQWRLANEQLTQMLGALDVTDGALTGNSTAGGSESQAAADPAESSSHTQHHLELLGERQTPQLTEQQ